MSALDGTCIFQPQATYSDTIVPVVNDGFWTWRIVAIDPQLTTATSYRMAIIQPFPVISTYDQR